MSVYAAFVPPYQIAAVIGAVILHEGTHLLLLRFCGQAPQQIHVGLFGMRMSEDCMQRLSYKDELRCVLGAPLANAVCFFILLPFTHRSSFVACSCAANLSLAAFNLLPLRMLDGGRTLQCILLQRCNLQTAHRGMLVFEWFAFGILLLCILYSCRNRIPNPTAAVFLLYLFFLFLFHK